MGIAIRSKRYSCGLGYYGFYQFRSLVAKQLHELFHAHYESRFEADVMLLIGEEKETFFKAYNKQTEQFISDGLVSIDVADFLYQADCDGKIDRKQAKQIFELIKDGDDHLSFGYIGRDDCTKLSDLKRVFSDGTKVSWY